jgi:hypothetical protein
VRGVMPAVPRVEEQQPLDIFQAGFGMTKRPAVLLRRDGPEQPDPTIMKGFKKFEGNFDRSVLCIIQPRPVRLLVRLDGGLGFR